MVYENNDFINEVIIPGEYNIAKSPKQNWDRNQNPPQKLTELSLKDLDIKKVHSKKNSVKRRATQKKKISTGQPKCRLVWKKKKKKIPKKCTFKSCGDYPNHKSLPLIKSCIFFQSTKCTKYRCYFRDLHSKYPKEDSCVFWRKDFPQPKYVPENGEPVPNVCTRHFCIDENNHKRQPCHLSCSKFVHLAKRNFLSDRCRIKKMREFEHLQKKKKKNCKKKKNVSEFFWSIINWKKI